MALVQTSGKIRASGSGDVNVTMPSNFTAGNTAIASGCRYEGLPTGLTINGTASALDSSTSSALSGVWIRRVSNLTGGSNAAVLDTPGGSDYNTFSIEERDDIDLTSPLDEIGSTSGSGTSISISTAGATDTANEVVYGAFNVEHASSSLGITATGSATASWTENDSNTYQGGGGAYRVESTTGTKSMTWTKSVSGNWRGCVASYRIASGGSLSGTLSKTLGAATATSAGALTISGSASRTLGATTLSAAAGLTISGVAASTLDAVSSSSAGALAISGALAGTLGAVTAVAAGDVVSGLSGSTAATLGALTATSAAALTISGAASITLGAASSSSVATLAISGALSASLGSLTAASEGAIAGSVDGSVSQTLGQLRSAALGSLQVESVGQDGGSSPYRRYYYGPRDDEPEEAQPKPEAVPAVALDLPAADEIAEAKPQEAPALPAAVQSIAEIGQKTVEQERLNHEQQRAERIRRRRIEEELLLLL